MTTGTFLKKKPVRIASGLLLAFSLAAGTAGYLAQNGYNLFDRADGSNRACAMDSTCRKLTTGEIALARTIFGDTIDYKRVKVFSRLMLPWKPAHASAYMWNGNIYVFDKGAQSRDYSAPGNGDAGPGLFLHEMTHVWQSENDPKFIARSLFSIVLDNFKYDDLYQYDIGDHRAFGDFNFEQQGDIISDYYSLREAFRAKTRDLVMDMPLHFTKTFNRETRQECRVLDQYQTVISASLPQPVEAKCAMYRPYVVFPVDRSADDPAPAATAPTPASTPAPAP